MLRLITTVALAAAALASPALALTQPAVFDKTTPYRYWLLGESNDGKESIYLRQMKLGKNADTGNFHGFLLLIDVDSRVVNYAYGRQYEIEFNCENRTYAPRATWSYAIDAQQNDVTMVDQADLIFNPIQPGGPFEMASKILCDDADTSQLNATEEEQVSQLIDDQYAKYAKVAAGK